MLAEMSLELEMELWTVEVGLSWADLERSLDDTAVI